MHLIKSTAFVSSYAYNVGRVHGQCLALLREHGPNPGAKDRRPLWWACCPCQQIINLAEITPYFFCGISAPVGRIPGLQI